jgi:hypothetical protein
MEHSSEPQGGQRVYRKPELKVLGDLATLTRHTGNTGSHDGAYDPYPPYTELRTH